MKFALCNGVIVRQEGDDAIVYDPNGNKLFLLNQTAFTAVKEIVDYPQTVEQLVFKIENKYEVLSTTCKEDLLSLFDELTKLNLICAIPE